MLAEFIESFDVEGIVKKCQPHCARWERYHLQSPSTPNTGETTPTFTNSRDVFLQLLSTSGSERLRGRQVDANVTHIFRARHASDVEPTYRLTKGANTTIINITAVTDDPDHLNHYMIIEGKEARP